MKKIMLFLSLIFVVALSFSVKAQISSKVLGKKLIFESNINNKKVESSELIITKKSSNIYSCLVKDMSNKEEAIETTIEFKGGGIIYKGMPKMSSVAESSKVSIEHKTGGFYYPLKAKKGKKLKDAIVEMKMFEEDGKTEMATMKYEFKRKVVGETTLNTPIGKTYCYIVESDVKTDMDFGFDIGGDELSGMEDMIPKNKVKVVEHFCPKIGIPVKGKVVTDGLLKITVEYGWKSIK